MAKAAIVKTVKQTEQQAPKVKKWVLTSNGWDLVEVKNGI